LLDEEEKRLSDVLFGSASQSTIKTLMAAFDEELIKAYKPSLIEKDTGFTYMIYNEQYEVCL